MSLYSSKLHLSPSLCLHLLCPLLLLTDSSCTEPKRIAGSVIPLFTTPTANCSTGCYNGSSGTDATTKEYSDTSSTGVASNPLPKNLSSTLDLNDTSLIFKQSSVAVTVTKSTTDKVNQSVRLPANVQSLVNLSSINNTTVKLNDSVTSAIASEETIEGAHLSTASPSYVQPLSPDHLTSLEAVTSILPFTTTGLPAQSLHTGSITSTGSVTETTVGNVHLVSAPATTPAPATTTTAAPHSSTTVKATANANITVNTAYGSNISSMAAMPHPSTGVEPIQTSSLTTSPSAITVTSADTTANKSKPFASATRVPMVEVAGAALTKQLMDTASLLAVLLFGLLFFLVTVAVFVKQAYESYRRKDYTQVDYLINGMYSDSGV